MAMNSINPIQFKQLLQLKDLGIHGNSINYKNISMQSDKFIVVKEASKISIIDIKRCTVNSLNISNIESAMMNPSTSVLAIKNENNFEIYNLSMKTKIKSICINDNILYWKWINPQTISYVTSKSVYHWSMEQNSKPIKKFDIISEERKIQFIDYNSSNDGNWLFLQAITKSTHNNSVEGVLQLYNTLSKKYQPKMNAYGGCFAYLNINNTNKTLFCFIRQEKLCIVEIGNNNNSNESIKIQKDIRFEELNDFIISMIPSNKFGCIYAISQKGYLYIFDLLTGKQIHYKKISNISLFYGIKCEQNGGIIICDRNGQLISISINENNYIKYILNVLNDQELALSIATRYNLNGAEDLFQLKFKELISKLEYEKAVQIAVNAPKQILRTPETISILESVPSATYPPDLQFYTLLLQNGSLNKFESIGLCQRILNAKPKEGIHKISKFLNEEKLYYCEELGDLLIKYDCKLAASIYYKSKVIFKTILCFIKLGNCDKIIQYCINENYTPDWKQILKNVHEMNRQNVVSFAKQLIDKKYILPMDVINIINDTELNTEFLLIYLNSKENEEKEDYELQTKLFEINLKRNPSFADSLFDDKKYTFYNKNYIAQLCEDSQLYHRALQNYENINDIKRVLQNGLNANLLKMDFLIHYFGTLTNENIFECLNDLLKYQSSQYHLKIVIEICIKYSEKLNVGKIINLFEINGCFMGLYSYLSNIINITKDADIIYKHIISCVKCKQFNQLKNICATNDYYNPEQIKNYLLENSNIISDPRALIHVCDRFDFISDLVKYLYTNEMDKFIEIYATKMNESSTPKVIGCLLDLNCSDKLKLKYIETLRSLLASFPFEKNKLWLANAIFTDTLLTFKTPHSIIELKASCDTTQTLNKLETYIINEKTNKCYNELMHIQSQILELDKSIQIHHEDLSASILALSTAVLTQIKNKSEQKKEIPLIRKRIEEKYDTDNKTEQMIDEEKFKKQFDLYENNTILNAIKNAIKETKSINAENIKYNLQKIKNQIAKIGIVDRPLINSIEYIKQEAAHPILRLISQDTLMFWCNMTGSNACQYIMTLQQPHKYNFFD